MCIRDRVTLCVLRCNLRVYISCGRSVSGTNWFAERLYAVIVRADDGPVLLLRIRCRRCETQARVVYVLLVDGVLEIGGSSDVGELTTFDVYSCDDTATATAAGILRWIVVVVD